MANVERAFAGIGSRPLLAVSGETATVADVVSASAEHGTLAALVAQTRGALAALAAGASPDPAAVREAGIRFRRERGLLAAEQLEQWLADRGLTVAQWQAHFRRALAGSAEGPVDDAELEAALPVDAVCSGFLGREARLLAEERATAGEDVEPSADEVAREISARTLDWTWVEADVLELPDPDVAREAALAVRADGRALADVAVDCGVPPRELAAVLADVPPELQGALRGAVPGELLGPVETAGGFAVVALRAKDSPSAGDARIRWRAEELLRRRRIDALVDAKVRFLGRE